MADSRCDRRPRGGWLVISVLLLACKDDARPTPSEPPPGDPTFGSDDGGAETTTSGAVALTSESGGTTFSGAACASADDCGDMYCSAPVVGLTPTPGEFVCGACVELDAPQRWCLDASSCCDAAATCDNGFCRGESTTEGSSTGATDGSSSTGDVGSSSSG